MQMVNVFTSSTSSVPSLVPAFARGDLRVIGATALPTNNQLMCGRTSRPLNLNKVHAYGKVAYI